MPDWAAVIMAAGKGTRMKSKLPKVMHLLAGKPMLQHGLDCVQTIGAGRSFVILGHGRDQIEEWLGDRAKAVIQSEQLGTGHAVMQVLPYLDEVEHILVLSGDQPLIRPQTLSELMRLHEQGSSATILTAHLDNPFGLGRVIKEAGKLQSIVEEKDATSEQREIHEINTGTYCFRVSELRQALQQITPKNAQGEYYLTDVFNILLAQGKTVATYATTDSYEALGINSREQLAEAEQVIRERLLKFWMNEGVTIIDPVSTFIDAEVSISRDVIIHPFTFLKGNTRIDEDAVIGPHVQLTDCQCQTGCEITHTVGNQAMIGPRAKVGPFAYLRPGTVLEADVKIGDFVEVKNSIIGEGAKIPHLSYIGDADVGKSANIGAGTITCNYDGVNKYRTRIEDNAFIGSNTNLVAPVTIGEGALTGAGSTIVKNVPPHALGLERSTQKNIENYLHKKKK